MTIIRPRLIDFFNIPVTQDEVDFAIPFLDEDIPLYLDPFLLWKSPSQQDQALHIVLVNALNSIGKNFVSGNRNKAIDILMNLSECREAGLGSGKTKNGLRIGRDKASEILELFSLNEIYNLRGLSHIEELQLFVENISKDRISDISCNLLKSFLIDFTQSQCEKYKIPVCKFLQELYDSRDGYLVKEEVDLPYNPIDKTPILLIPKRWLRYMPWISYEDYFKNSFIDFGKENLLDRSEILNYNRRNYNLIKTYIASKERTQADCKIDPLFKQIPILSAKKCYSSIIALPSGKGDNSDKKYENSIVRLMASLLYPHLDFAKEQSRTDSGTHIRDLIFYNNCSYPFLAEISDKYRSNQLIFEMKNVHDINRDHINQLNRYLSDSLGSFGILVTRNRLKRAVFRNTIDLWSGQRKCIICLDDEDLRLMVDVFESKQRDPIEVINMKYVEFIRSCPS